MLSAEGPPVPMLRRAKGLAGRVASFTVGLNGPPRARRFGVEGPMDESDGCIERLPEACDSVRLRLRRADRRGLGELELCARDSLEKLMMGEETERRAIVRALGPNSMTTSTLPVFWCGLKGAMFSLLLSSRS